ncbi:hypothetical protein Gorai_001261, partial [Gossypium raimondii]|nr:hypothetical protein [Gossypium raimondii]
ASSSISTVATTAVTPPSFYFLSPKSPIAATTSTSTAAFKAVFKPSRGGGNRIRFLPELQRVKSFSASKKEGSQKTLWSLFYRDAERNPHKKETAGNGRPFEIDEVEAPNLGSSSNVFQGPVFESKEEGRTESGIDHAGVIEIIEEQPNAFESDLKEIARSFWSAASIFKKPIGRYYRETQSEIVDYGFGRRSCDMDPRFSLDAGRMSLDAARMSCQTLPS